MRTVLHIIDTTGPGGAETVFIELVKATALQDGYASIALVRGPGWVLSELERLAVPHFVLECKGSFNYRYLVELIRLIKSQNIDIIQAHLLGSAVYASIAGAWCKKPVYSTFHGLVDIGVNERFKWAKLLALRLGSKKIITVTDRLNAMMKSLRFVADERIKTIYNGINIADFETKQSDRLRTDLNIGDDLLVGSVGNIRVPKNYPLAIETIYKLHQQGLKAHYVIAGQGSDEQLKPLIAHIREYELEDFVHILGFVCDVRMLLSSLNIFLMTSSSEGHPLALTQAMINGVPIVTTPSGVEEIVTHEVDALVTQNHDATELAAAIKQLYCNSGQALLFQRNALKKARELFSLRSMTTQYLSLYEGQN